MSLAAESCCPYLLEGLFIMMGQHYIIRPELLFITFD
jgi:hypothetical protein